MCPGITAASGYRPPSACRPSAQHRMPCGFWPIEPAGDPSEDQLEGVVAV